MKQLLLLILCLLAFGTVNANPYYSTDIPACGYGVVEFDQDLDLYEEPNFDSKLLMTLVLSHSSSNFTMMGEAKGSSYYMLAENKKKDKAYLLVVDENDNGWYKVAYGKKEGLFGWVNLPANQFMSLKDFYFANGRKNGVYIFKDIPPDERKLYAQPFEKAEDKKTVANYDHAYKIKLEIIKGNWMLVRVLDINNAEKIGYLRWRSDDGKLLLFPNL